LTGPFAWGIGGQEGNGEAVIGSSGRRMGWEVFKGASVVLYISHAMIGASKAR